MGWQESDSLSEKYREPGQAHASRARVPLHGEGAMPRGGHQKHAGDPIENLTATMPATVSFPGNAPSRRSTTEREGRERGRGRGRRGEGERGEPGLARARVGGEGEDQDLTSNDGGADGGVLWEPEHTREPAERGIHASVGDGPETPLGSSDGRVDWEEMDGMGHRDAGLHLHPGRLRGGLGRHGLGLRLSSLSLPHRGILLHGSMGAEPRPPNGEGNRQIPVHRRGERTIHVRGPPRESRMRHSPNGEGDGSDRDHRGTGDRDSVHARPICHTPLRGKVLERRGGRSGYAFRSREGNLTWVKPDWMEGGDVGIDDLWGSAAFVWEEVWRFTSHSSGSRHLPI